MSAFINAYKNRINLYTPNGDIAVIVIPFDDNKFNVHSHYSYHQLFNLDLTKAQYEQFKKDNYLLTADELMTIKEKTRGAIKNGRN